MLHIFDGELPDRIEIPVPLPENCACIVEEVYSDTKETVCVQGGKLVYEPSENWKAVAVLIQMNKNGDDFSRI